MKTIAEIITDLPTICNEAKDWLLQLPADTTPAEAWEQCQRGDWMAWIASRIGVQDEEHWIWADMARLWAVDALDSAGIKHTLRDCQPIVDKDAAYVAADAAYAAYAAAASDAAYAAAYAAADAAYAADAAAYAAADAAYAADAADVIRQRIQNPFILEADE